MKGTVFNIQTYSIHDGPGIRTTVFLKGCPLDCLWCQNPESKQVEPQLMYYPDLCVGCGACVPACSIAAVQMEEGRPRTDRRVCAACGDCVKLCPTSAREITGQEMEAEEVAKKACADKIFYEDSGGGVTLSGGEVLAQPSFAREVLRLCKQQGVHTAIETSGFAKWESLKSVLDYVDLVMYDFKSMDAQKHKQYTGVDNALILDNAKKIVHELGKPLVARIPLITGMTDNEENITAIAKFIAEELEPGTRAHLLAYNSLGESKNASLEREDALHLESTSEEQLQAFKKILEDYGLEAVIGG